MILAEDDYIQGKLFEHDIKVQTMQEVRPLQVFPARVLTQIYSLLGEWNGWGASSGQEGNTLTVYIAHTKRSVVSTHNAK